MVTAEYIPVENEVIYLEKTINIHIVGTEEHVNQFLTFPSH